MSQYLELKPEFNIGVEDAQEVAKVRLGRELSPEELEQVQRAVSSRLYEIECKMVEAEIVKLPTPHSRTRSLLPCRNSARQQQPVGMSLCLARY